MRLGAAQNEAVGDRDSVSAVNGRAVAMPPSAAKQETKQIAVRDEIGLPPEAAESTGDSGYADTNVWPTATEEAAFLAEAQQRGEKVVPIARDVVEEIEDDKKALPKLDELVNRIPAETRELLDELFRARFVAVRRVKKKDLKS